MSGSIEKRIFHLFFFINLIFLTGILLFSWWALEDLEETMLESDRQVEVQHFAENGEKNKPQHTSTGQLVSAFIPNGFDKTQYLPVLFTDIPVPFQGEIEFLGEEYSVITQAFPEGDYYLAKNLQLFETRERTLILYVLTMALVIGISCFLLARLFSKRISAPVLRLASAISNIADQGVDARMEGNFVDSELNAVAEAINGYRSRLDASMAREKKLISMASHELRTPVAVIMGAARIIESRRKLNADDAKTLQRIITAADEMSANIQTLLALVRQGKPERPPESFAIGDMLAALCDDYALEQPAHASRLLLDRHSTPVFVTADRALVRMLLHNLISNALNHTQGTVLIREQSGGIAICDQGSATASKPVLDHAGTVPTSGLGLYIVSLACEQLGWQLELADSGGGTCVNVSFNGTMNN